MALKRINKVGTFISRALHVFFVLLHFATTFLPRVPDAPRSLSTILILHPYRN